CASGTMRFRLARCAISMSESTDWSLLVLVKSKSGRGLCRFCAPFGRRRLLRWPEAAVFRMGVGRAARADADELQDHFLVLGAIEMIAVGGVLHVATRLDRPGGLRIEGLARARPPGALDHDG